MSNLEELIERLCPDGVEYKTIRDICKKIASGGTPTASKSEYYNGYIPWLRTQEVDWKDILDTEIKITELGYNNSSTKWIPKNCVIVAMYGATAAKVAINKIPLTTNQACCNLEIDERIAEYKYVYYWLCKEYINLKSLGQGSQHNINANIIKNYKLPVPPLEVQREIVRILDNFTFLTTELAAELAARQKQYEYYRDLLLTFKSNESTILNELELSGAIRWMKLGELCDYVDYRGKTPKKVDQGIFLVTAKNVRMGFIDYEKSKEYISKDDYLEVMRRGLPKIGDLLITTEAPCGNVALVDREDIALAQRIIKYRPKRENVNRNFLKHYLLSKEFQDVLQKNATGGIVKGIKGSKLHELNVPVPPLEVQQRIVGILDRFDTLCNDISSGLPAEIEMRQKQYEYYRDKLLTFKELKKEA
jgi:type I restriction enzyme S subunit